MRTRSDGDCLPPVPLPMIYFEVGMSTRSSGQSRVSRRGAKCWIATAPTGAATTMASTAMERIDLTP